MNLEAVNTYEGKRMVNTTIYVFPRAHGNKFSNREFKKLRRQLQRKRHIKIELSVKLSLLRLFHVDHVVQNTRIALSLAWYERFSCKGKERKIYCCELALSSEPQIWKFHVVVWQTTSKHLHQKACPTCSTIVFLHSTNQIIYEWRCRWRCRRQNLNSLIWLVLYAVGIFPSLPTGTVTREVLSFSLQSHLRKKAFFKTAFY